MRQTLKIIEGKLPNLKTESISSGSKVFDWDVPKEWEVTEAFITTPEGKRICDFSENNLHLVGYSVPFEAEMGLAELQKHLYSLESQPEAIPYVTSYYQNTWGFCISHNQRKALNEGMYRVVVRTRLFDGVLNYGELLIPGKSSREVFFSTYICHPSMANNELSGPALAVELAKLLSGQRNYYSYRFVFLPETIGSLIYMARNLAFMKRNIVAGYVLTCVGDERGYSFVPSRLGRSAADKAATRVLHELGIDYKHWSWSDRGSDERQYCSPGADLPVCSVMRSKYGTYPEYHTSLDKIGDVVTVQGLQGAFDVYEAILQDLETNRFPIACHVGEPQLGRRGLYPNISMKDSYSETATLVNVLSMADGQTSIQELASMFGVEIAEVDKIVRLLQWHGLVDL